MSNYPLMVLGRVAIGLGGETLPIAKAMSIIKWFSKQEQAFGFSCALAFSRVGSMANSFFTPRIFETSESLSDACVVGVSTCVLSLITAVFFVLMDLKADRVEKLQDEQHQVARSLTNPTKEERTGNENIFVAIGTFQRTYWLLIIGIAFVFGSYFGFSNVSSNFLQERGGFTNEQAGELLSVQYLGCAILTPIIGRLIDIIGQRDLMMIFSGSLLSLVYLVLSLLPDEEGGMLYYFPLAGYAFFFAMFPTNCWCTIPLLVNFRYNGKAFGLSIGLLQLFNTLIPLIVGALRDDTQAKHGYFWVTIFVFILSVIGNVFLVLMRASDTKKVLRKSFTMRISHSDQCTMTE